MATIGTAYVQILPSAEGIKGNLEKALGGEVSAAGSSLANNLGSGLKSGLGVVAKGAVAGIAAAGAAAVTLGKQAVSSYAEYEQLVGGVETLFGEDMAATVMQNADNAFKTAGMSANEYMQTAISSSAAMIKSLGGDQTRAAELTDMAIRDMSDNVNKMGTSMDMIQHAYTGFSRGNFTMLDNLSLGFAGTKEGMQELLASAEQISGVKYDISSYADIVEAIHVVQTEMGITGTTAAEAAGTIAGSTGSVKAAWANLITGIADDNANFDVLFDNFINSLMSMVDNIMPRITTAMDGIGKLVVKGAEKILPVVIQTITANLPQLITTGVQLIITLITGIIQALPQLVAALPQIFQAILGAFRDNWPALKQAGSDLLQMVIDGLSNAVSWLWGKVSDIGRSVVDQIYSGIASKWGELVGWFNNLWDGLFGNRSVSVGVSGGGGSVGRYATGLDYVPYDEFPAILHKGEAVLTASEASDWRRSGLASDAGPAAQGSELMDVLGQLSQFLGDLRENGVPAYAYLDGRAVSDTVTKYQRRAARARA